MYISVNSNYSLYFVIFISNDEIRPTEVPFLTINSFNKAHPTIMTLFWYITMLVWKNLSHSKQNT